MHFITLLVLVFGILQLLLNLHCQGAGIQKLPNLNAPSCQPRCQNNGTCIGNNECQCPENFRDTDCSFYSRCEILGKLENARTQCQEDGNKPGKCWIICNEGYNLKDLTNDSILHCVNGGWFILNENGLSAPRCLKADDYTSTGPESTTQIESTTKSSDLDKTKYTLFQDTESTSTIALTVTDNELILYVVFSVMAIALVVMLLLAWMVVKTAMENKNEAPRNPSFNPNGHQTSTYESSLEL